MPRGLAREQFKAEMRAAWEAVDKNFDPELIFGKLLGCAVFEIKLTTFFRRVSPPPLCHACPQPPSRRLLNINLNCSHLYYRLFTLKP